MSRFYLDTNFKIFRVQQLPSTTGEENSVIDSLCSTPFGTNEQQLLKKRLANAILINGFDKPLVGFIHHLEILYKHQDTTYRDYTTMTGFQIIKLK
ncbi:unnamed protein product [Ambrosiozyma monospora]|uniref:Unnamed protein product n=1 Tax=Ambrosiozyma monospora TaxID=43982 RepID=A0ACB5T5R3_AMBMO|nr:unnamed protein product [Ambrosiozyma monospora]